MFVAVAITAYITVFALFLTAVTIGLVTDHRRNRQGQRSLQELKRHLATAPFDGGHRGEAGTGQEVRR